MPDKIVVFDLETSGRDHKLHRIIQIAAIAIDCTRTPWQVIDTFERKVQFDENAALPDALEMNSYDAETWDAEAWPAPSVWKQLLTFLRKHATVRKVSKRTGNPYTVAKLCGHNVRAFDMLFLLAWKDRTGDFLPADFIPVDTLDRANWLRDEGVYNYDSLSLEALCAYHGITGDEHVQTHDAMDDAVLAAKLYAFYRGKALNTTVQQVDYDAVSGDSGYGDLAAPPTPDHWGQ